METKNPGVPTKRATTKHFRVAEHELALFQALKERRGFETDTDYILDLIRADGELLFGDQHKLVVAAENERKSKQLPIRPLVCCNWEALEKRVGLFITAVEREGRIAPRWTKLVAPHEEKKAGIMPKAPAVCCGEPQPEFAGGLILCGTCDAELSPMSAARALLYCADCAEEMGNIHLAESHRRQAKRCEDWAGREAQDKELATKRLAIARTLLHERNTLAPFFRDPNPTLPNGLDEILLNSIIRELSFAGNDGAHVEWLIARLKPDSANSTQLEQKDFDTAFASGLAYGVKERRLVVRVVNEGNQSFKRVFLKQPLLVETNAIPRMPCLERHGSGLVCTIPIGGHHGLHEGHTPNGVALKWEVNDGDLAWVDETFAFAPPRSKEARQSALATWRKNQFRSENSLRDKYLHTLDAMVSYFHSWPDTRYSSIPVMASNLERPKNKGLNVAKWQIAMELPIRQAFAIGKELGLLCGDEWLDVDLKFHLRKSGCCANNPATKTCEPVRNGGEAA